MLDLSRRGQLFASQPFRWYIVSCLLITLGGGLQYINLTWLVLQAHDSVRGVAFLMLSFWVPAVLLGPIAGVVADRYSARWILIICNFLRAVVLLLFCVFWLAGFQVQVWQICLMNVFMGIALGFFSPVLLVYVREIVAPKDLLYANSTVDIAYEIGNVVGMGSAGLLLAVMSVETALLFNALFFVASTVALLLSRPPKHRASLPRQQAWLAGICHDYVSGMAYLLKNRRLCVLYLAQLFVVAIFMVSPVLLAPYAKNVLRANVGQFGGLEASISVGVVMGGLVSPWIAARFGTIKTIIVESVLMLLAYLLFCFNYNLAIADVLNVFIGIGLSVWPLIVTLAQSKTDLAFQGRVQSTFSSLSGVLIVFIYLLASGYGPDVSIRSLFSIQILFSLFVIILLFIYHLNLRSADKLNSN